MAMPILKLTRSEKIALAFAIASTGILGLFDLFDAYSNMSTSKPRTTQTLEGVVLMICCIGFITKKRFAPIIYLGFNLVIAGLLLKEGDMFGAIFAPSIAIAISLYLHKAFIPKSSDSLKLSNEQTQQS